MNYSSFWISKHSFFLSILFIFIWQLLTKHKHEYLLCFTITFIWIIKKAMTARFDVYPKMHCNMYIILYGCSIMGLLFLSKYINLSWYDSLTDVLLHRIKLRSSRRVSSSCSTSGTCRVNLVTNQVISHEWGKEREVFTTSGTYPLWSFVTQIFHNGQPSHGGDRKTFKVMTST